MPEDQSDELPTETTTSSGHTSATNGDHHSDHNDITTNHSHSTLENSFSQQPLQSGEHRANQISNSQPMESTQQVGSPSRTQSSAAASATTNATTTTTSNQPSPSHNISSRPQSSAINSVASMHSLHPQLDLKLNERFMLMPLNDQIRELQTVIRDKETSRGDFKFYADRLIRLVVEEGLNQLPIEKIDVMTPTGHIFKGIRYLKGNCGVSIVRSGESMEQGLRDCCRSIRIGKILIESDENNQARVLYAKFPPDIAERKILLLYPIMSTGLAVIESVKVLLNHGVKEENLILLNLFSSPRGARLISRTFAKMSVLTSDINPVCPNHFGQRYFGTD